MSAVPQPIRAHGCILHAVWHSNIVFTCPPCFPRSSTKTLWARNAFRSIALTIDFTERKRNLLTPAGSHRARSLGQLLGPTPFLVDAVLHERRNWSDSVPKPVMITGVMPTFGKMNVPLVIVAAIRSPGLRCWMYLVDVPIFVSGSPLFAGIAMKTTVSSSTPGV